MILFDSNICNTFGAETKYFLSFPHIKFHKIPSSDSREVPCARTDRQTDRHNKANNRFLVAIAKYRKATISFVMSVCPHGTPGLPLDGRS